MPEAETTEAAKPRRSLLAFIFISGDERRLRAGWRLLIHTIWLVVLLVVLGLVLGLALSLLTLLIGFDPTTLIGQSTAAVVLDTSLMLVVFTTVTWAARRFLDRRSFVSLGFTLDRHTLPDLLFGIGLGGLLMALIYAFESAVGWLTFQGWAWQRPGAVVIGPLLLALFQYLAVGYYEELFSRGYHLQNLTDGLNLPWGIFLSSAVFSLLHLLNPNRSVFSVIGILAAGFFLAYGWVRTRRLWIPIGIHIGWNFFQGTVFGFPVSGDMEGFHLILQTVTGPRWITGGVFGPEAGLTGLVACALGTALIWLYTQRRTPQATPDAAPAAPKE
jgi:membrane protease YdiL (CAAX protease family)